MERILLADDQRIAARDYQMRRHDADARPILIDVRSDAEFAICHLPEALSKKHKSISKFERIENFQIVRSKT